MSFTDVYIGSLEDTSFVQDAEGLRANPELWHGNTPSHISPFFPHPGARGDPFFEAGRLGAEAIQTDWGCTVYKATGAQIQKLYRQTYPNLAEWYRVHTQGAWAGKDIAADMRQLEAVVAGLDPAKKYALVSIEMS